MRLTASDRQCFEQQTAGLLDGLYGAALRLCRNRADAQDLVAEAVARAWSSFGALRDRQAFRAWVFRILTNVFFCECRKQREVCVREPDEARSADEEGAFSLFERLHQPFLLSCFGGVCRAGVLERAAARASGERHRSPARGLPGGGSVG